MIRCLPARSFCPRLPLRHQALDRIDRIHLPRPEALIVPRILADRNRQRLTANTCQRLLCPPAQSTAAHRTRRRTAAASSAAQSSPCPRPAAPPHSAPACPPCDAAGHHRPAQNRRTPAPAVQPAISVTACSARAIKAAFSKKIRRRISAHRQLRKHHQIGPILSAREPHIQESSSYSRRSLPPSG